MIEIFAFSLGYAIFLAFTTFKQVKRDMLIRSFMLKEQEHRGASRDFKSILAELFFDFFQGIYSKPSGFKAKGAITLVIVIIAFYIANSIFLSFNPALIIIAGILFGGYITKIFYLKSIVKDFENTFPEALVLINGAISSGNNISSALKDCADQISGVLKIEFNIITKSLNVGDDPARIFEASFRRLPFKTYYFFLTALLVSLQSGARLKEVLSRLSIANQRAKAIDKKKDAMTSEARMSSKITAGIPFVFLFLMKFISPENFDFVMHNPDGRYILYYFLGSELVGVLIILFLMRKI